MTKLMIQYPPAAAGESICQCFSFNFSLVQQWYFYFKVISLVKSVLTADTLISLYPHRVGSKASQVYENPQTFKFHSWPSVSMDSSPVNSTKHGRNFPFVVGGIHGFKAHRYGGPTTYLLKKKNSKYEWTHTVQICVVQGTKLYRLECIIEWFIYEKLGVRKWSAIKFKQNRWKLDFPRGTSDKETACQWRRHERFNS